MDVSISTNIKTNVKPKGYSMLVSNKHRQNKHTHMIESKQTIFRTKNFRFSLVYYYIMFFRIPRNKALKIQRTVPLCIFMPFLKINPFFSGVHMHCVKRTISFLNKMKKEKS